MMTIDRSKRAVRFCDVSVILPLYNGRRHLHTAVKSIAAQTVQPRELIVVDDGSTDEAANELDGALLPFRLNVVRQANAGQSSARNHGARLAELPFLAFLDQDDVWLPDHLRTLLEPMRRPSVAWAYGDFDEIDGEGRVVTKRYLREHGIPHPKSTLIACLSRDLMVIPSASLLRREAFFDVGGFDEDLSGYEDDDLFIRLFRRGWDHSYIDQAVTRFRIHAGSSSDSQRFIASRARFGHKLKATVEDDIRFRRYYYQDVIVPRFFQQCLDDYVRSVSFRDWPAAIVARDAMNEFARERSDIRRKSIKLRLIQNPRALRRVLRLQKMLPRSVQLSANPAMRLR
jgi:glycosyltransferase involved in cell wall biosynthesis